MFHFSKPVASLAKFGLFSASARLFSTAPGRLAFAQVNHRASSSLSAVPLGRRLLATSTSSTAPSSSVKKPVVRPISPHLTIYEPQLTWVMSIMHRVTGAGLAVGVWGGSLAYLSGALTAASAVSTVAALPTVVVVAGKLVLATPFAYHTWNGVRHLLWDFGYFLSLKQVYQTGYAVGGATLATTIGLLLM